MAAEGTELYCAECKTWTKQKSLGWSDKYLYEGVFDEPGRYSFPHIDGEIHIFMRVRQCQKCAIITETFEVSQDDFMSLKIASEKLRDLKLAIKDGSWVYTNNIKEELN
jgi:hypothetical protein